MIAKHTSRRRKFAHDWDEITFLYHKVLSWLYARQDRPKALQFCDRLEKLLQKASPKHDAVFGEECWSLLSEARGKLAEAIKYREHEIALIKKLRRVSHKSSTRSFVLRGYDIGDLSDRLDLLAILYHDTGDLEKALTVLRQSKALCTTHGIQFDGEELLHEYLSERKAFAEVNGQKTSRSPRRRHAKRHPTGS
jgi:hypothetical protein